VDLQLFRKFKIIEIKSFSIMGWWIWRKFGA